MKSQRVKYDQAKLQNEFLGNHLFTPCLNFTVILAVI